MKNVKSVNLEIKVCKYENEDEMNKHIASMVQEGYKVKNSGKAYLGKEHKVTAFLDESNWDFVAEFSRESVDANENYDYETHSYVF